MATMDYLPPEELIKKLLSFKTSVRASLESDSYLLPLYSYEKMFDFGRLAYVDRQKNQLSLNSKNVWTVARLLEIVEVVVGLIGEQQIITKRNLYYKLVRYYQNRYIQVDDDLDLLCFNLETTREQIRVFSSSRCLLFGHLAIKSVNITCVPEVITNIPLFDSSAEVSTRCKTMVIIQKQSALYQIHQQLSLLSSKGDPGMKEIMDQTIFISSKGYPDGTTKNLVTLLYPFIEKIYFMGDSDIYGLDILLCYAIAYKQWSCLLAKMHWVQLQRLVQPKEESLDYLVQSKEDKLKSMAILERAYFKEIDYFIPNNPEEAVFKTKLSLWRDKAREIHKNKKKIELQCLFKDVDEGWILKALRPEYCL